MTKILNVTTQMAPYTFDTETITQKADDLWLKHIDPDIRRVTLKLFKGAEIDRRSSAFPLEVVFAPLDFQQKNDLYKKAAIELGEKVLRIALKESGTKPEELSFIISTSCTGFMIPSVDAYLINALGLRQDIIRVPITEMGCAGGTSATIYADQFLKANPKAKGVIISVELPSITFQPEDYAMENLVSTAIFADGASAVILGGSEVKTSEPVPHIVDTAMYHFPDATHLMGYNLQNSGLKIVLDRDVPQSINSHFNNIMVPFLTKNGLEIKDIDHCIFHPGGKKIINAVEDYLGRFGKNVDISKKILRENGNMSSSTVLFILSEFMQKKPKVGDRGYMLAFGPGFTAQSLLLEWK